MPDLHGNGQQPLSFPQVPLSDLISIQSGYAFKSQEYAERGHLLIRIGNVQDGYISTDNAKYVSLDDRTKQFELSDGDILTSLTGNIGRVARITQTDLPAALNQRVAKFIISQPNAIAADYLYFCLGMRDFRDRLSFDSGGAAQQNVSPSAIGSITIPLPPLDEQRRIAEVLRSVDDAVASADAVVRDADRSLKLLAEQLLVAEAEATGGWARLGDLLASVEAGVSVNSEGRPAENGELGILKTSCVSAARFDPSEHKAVLNNERNRVRVPVAAGSIIVSRMNTLDLVGANAFIADDHPNLYLPDRLWLLKTNANVRCRWLAYYMKTARFRGQIVDIASGTSGSMKNISKGRLVELPIYIPSIQLQDAAVEVLSSMEETARGAASALESNKLIKASLSGDLLSGRVRVPE